jgi:hypothetical protein
MVGGDEEVRQLERSGTPNLKGPRRTGLNKNYAPDPALAAPSGMTFTFGAAGSPFP